MKKSLVVLLALALTVAMASSASAAVLFLSDNNIATATVGVNEVFSVEWSNSAAQASFGSLDLSSGEVFALADQHLIVTMASNQYSDYRAVIYLRNWDNSGDANDANPLCTLSNSGTPEVPKGLVRVNGGDAVMLTKWGAEVIGSTNQITIDKTPALATWNLQDGSWSWFLDETYAPDAAFRTDTSQYGQLNYATITTKGELNWAGTTSADVYMMVRATTDLPAGQYRTNTITVEIMSE